MSSNPNNSKQLFSYTLRFYAVLKDEWLYLYKKPSDTCTVDAYDMPSYVVSANVGSDSLRNFTKNQKLSISLEHKVIYKSKKRSVLGKVNPGFVKRGAEHL